MAIVLTFLEIWARNCTHGWGEIKISHRAEKIYADVDDARRAAPEPVAIVLYLVHLDVAAGGWAEGVGLTP
jgi:hypothetical protein